jgi:hypothetical protein
MTLPSPILSRADAVAQLNGHGIEDKEIYLIDIIPLIEMIWADGCAQESEIAVLEGFIRVHVDHLNQVAGYELLTLDAAHAFMNRFLDERPDPDLMRTLRSLISIVRLSNSSEAVNDALRKSLLAACLDIATVPCGERDLEAEMPFDPQEKRCFFEILETLEGVRPGAGG